MAATEGAARVILIVGGAGGMGRATAARLAGPGVHLALAELDEAGLAAGAGALAAGPARVSTHRLDVRNPAACRAVVDEVARLAERYGAGDPEGYRRALLAKYPQRARARFIQPEEIAATIAWICSPEAAPVSGAAVSLDFAITAGY